MTATTQPTALITGASKGLGRALAQALLDRGWQVVATARGGPALRDALPGALSVAGDVRDPVHRAALAREVERLGRLDLLVNNASSLGTSPLPSLAAYDLDELRAVFETNVVAPLALIQLLLPALQSAPGVLLDVSSDAAVEAYPGWGGYGSSKAALDHVTATVGAEEAPVRAYAVDPGDMRTAMHQAAFPGEDIGDRPEPAEVVPALLRLLDARPVSGRYRAADWAPVAAGGAAVAADTTAVTA